MANMFNQLPCLRCGEEAILVPPLFKGVGRDLFDCRCCDATMYLSVQEIKGSFRVVYDRYTQRYGLENYDDSHPVLAICKKTKRVAEGDGFNLHVSEPVFIFPRKKYFSKKDLKSIWAKTHGRCHICWKEWALGERSRNGWHIDHIIPNYGGGEETELLSNFKIACARCNLKKGKGFTDREVRYCINELLADLYGHE